MISEKQLAANRQNAHLSTGPRTEEGKAIVARNGVKHGIFVRVADDGEEKEIYDVILSGLREDLKPEGQMEDFLVAKIALDQWRLGRVIAYEAACIRLEVSELKSSMQCWHGPQRPSRVHPDRTETAPLEFLKYTDEVSEANIAAHADLLARLSNRELPLEGEGAALEFVYRTKAKPCRWDEPMPPDWREKALAWLGGLAPAQKASLRTEVLRREQKVHEEMKAVWTVRSKIAEFLPLHTMPKEEMMERIMKYEKAFQNSIVRNTELLQKLQASRRSSAAPKMARG